MEDDGYSANTGKGIDKFYAYIREAFHKLNGKVLFLLHKLPFSDMIGECGDGFDFEVGEGRNNLHLNIRKRGDYPYPSGKAYVPEISVSADGGGSRMDGKTGHKKEE